MATPTTFARYELKYLITDTQQQKLFEQMQHHTKPDGFGKSTICNIYFDTPDSLLIRRSLEKPVYKEKLRVRSYGPVPEDAQVFIELKKKYKGVVYKRRVALPCYEAAQWLQTGRTPAEQTQIMEEIEYFRSFYSGLTPAVYLSYDREAFFGTEDENLRLTFDQNIRWRNWGLSLSQKPGGWPLLAANQRLLEIKCGYGMPLWLTHFLSEEGIFKTSFSKYGNAYLAMNRAQRIDYAGITSASTHNAHVDNAAIHSVGMHNPSTLNPAILDPAILDPAMYNPAMYNPAMYNPAMHNPSTLDPAVLDPAVLNADRYSMGIYNTSTINTSTLNPSMHNADRYNMGIYNTSTINTSTVKTGLINANIDKAYGESPISTPSGTGQSVSAKVSSALSSTKASSTWKGGNKSA